MADQEEDDLRMALRMSMQNSPPEPKRSKPRDAIAGAQAEDGEPSDVRNRRLQRELMAAAAEKRMLLLSPPKSSSTSRKMESARSASAGSDCKAVSKGDKELGLGDLNLNLGRELSESEAEELFSMVFGVGVSKGILAQWSNQGIRFSTDPETSMGLVQHEGGPCGVLAAIQAFVLKYLLFFPEELGNGAKSTAQISAPRSLSKSQYVASKDFASLHEDVKTRALIRSMAEILFVCGGNKSAVVVTLNVIGHDAEDCVGILMEDENMSKKLEGLSIETALDLQKVLRVNVCSSQTSAFQKLEAMIPVFRSRMGAMLFLISALLSRGLDSVQADRDDPSLPLVTAPFGHASQEIVNLLLCGQAVANVFDGCMDLGGGMSLKGISKTVEVGFLTLLESLNFCKVGHNLKSPKWPIWVVGSESHYTVLFALDSSVQDENELEARESQIRKAFDSQDQSGGGGFIGVEGFQQVVRETNIRLSPEKTDQLCGTGFIVWSEFWQVILDLDKDSGGLKDSSGLMGKKVFTLFHFNGIAKSDRNGSCQAVSGETPAQRPRLTELRVSVPPRWTPEEYMADVAAAGSSSAEKENEVSKPDPPQHAPLVDCVRTRWPRAVCNWIGDPPSIV